MEQLRIGNSYRRERAKRFGVGVHNTLWFPNERNEPLRLRIRYPADNARAFALGLDHCDQPPDVWRSQSQSTRDGGYGVANGLPRPKAEQKRTYLVICLAHQ